MSSLALVLAADQETDCQNRIMVDVAPVVGSGTSSSSTVETVSVDGRSAFLARQTNLGEQADTFNATAAAALYSQYAVIQQHFWLFGAFDAVPIFDSHWTTVWLQFIPFNGQHNRHGCCYYR
ncbi:hypothetical protein D917_10514 [Trichinella nativa]|uniref:Uncharacterized protein n=1 Tax=Trichinella nativa TaxID=6335 RepID=A0A1Y3EA48_9BILA|nr:hypothetical protein D917_10514 [Trichinella nativa]